MRYVYLNFILKINPGIWVSETACQNWHFVFYHIFLNGLLFIYVWRWIKWMLENACKISRRRDRNRFAATVSTKVSYISKQIASPPQQVENGTCEYATTLQTCSKDVCTVFQFLSCRDLNPIDIRCEILPISLIHSAQMAK